MRSGLRAGLRPRLASSAGAVRFFGGRSALPPPLFAKDAAAPPAKLPAPAAPAATVAKMRIRAKVQTQPAELKEQDWQAALPMPLFGKSHMHARMKEFNSSLLAKHQSIPRPQMLKEVGPAAWQQMKEIHNQPVVWEQMPAKRRRGSRKSRKDAPDASVHVFVSGMGGAAQGQPPAPGDLAQQLVAQQQQQAAEVRARAQGAADRAADDAADAAAESEAAAAAEGAEADAAESDAADAESEPPAVTATSATVQAEQLNVQVIDVDAKGEAASTTFTVPLSALADDAAGAGGEPAISIELSSVKKKRKIKMNKHKRRKRSKLQRHKNESAKTS